MGFFSRLFGRRSEAERAAAREEEIRQAFPFMRQNPSQQEAKPAPRFISLPVPEAPPLENREEEIARKIKKLLLSASFHASRNQLAFSNLSAQLAALGDVIRAGGIESWHRIRQRVEILSGEHFVGLADYYDLLGHMPAPGPAPVAAEPKAKKAKPKPAPPTEQPAVTKEPAGVTKPVFRLDENSRASFAGGLAADTYILFGALAEEGLEEAMADDDIHAIVIAKQASLLKQLPERMDRCSLEYLYPTERTGGLSATDPPAVDAFRHYLTRQLEPALALTTGVLPLVLVAPVAGMERLMLMCLWIDSVSAADVMRFAAALDDLLRPSGSAGQAQEAPKKANSKAKPNPKPKPAAEAAAAAPDEAREYTYNFHYIGEEHHTPREAAVHAGLTVIEELDFSNNVIALNGFGEKVLVNHTGNGPVATSIGWATPEEMQKWAPPHRPAKKTYT
ncbi:MAG: hypothetical protein U0984_01370 [Prosthecobacter sp.]|nr:hypothetical protein [Prosthecobacter sp.]